MQNVCGFIVFPVSKVGTVTYFYCISMTFLMMLSVILLSLLIAATRVGFWSWIWPTRYCVDWKRSDLWFQFRKKHISFHRSNDCEGTDVRAYSRKKGHWCDFSEKGQNIWKFGQKCVKFENILKKGSLMGPTIACMKQLEYAMDVKMDEFFLEKNHPWWCWDCLSF